MSEALAFTNTWFGPRIAAVWDQLFQGSQPARALEIGCYEGASACGMIRRFARCHPLQRHCGDTWTGGVEHRSGDHFETDMREVEARFDPNTQVALDAAVHSVEFVKHKGATDGSLARLLIDKHQAHFDFIYVDGSHRAADVPCEAVLGFRLLKIGGVIAFDDFHWRAPQAALDLLRCPKLAIDAFSTLPFDRLKVVFGSAQQFYFEKTGA